MFFNSYNFLIFFPIVVLVYFVIPKRIQHIWLLAASYYFYMCWNAKYAILLLFVTTVTYVCGRILDRLTKDRYRKIIVALCVAGNLSVLFVFKYLNFLIDTLNGILAGINVELVIPEHDLLLPVGISFYIFQALSYTFDLYRSQVKVEKNFLRYALFVSFFPQLVAGPIERSRNLLKQVNEEHSFCFERMREGLLVMMWGFFLKLVIADRAAVVVDCVYNDYSTYGGLYLLIATMLFAVQIYCDFAGYSTIAVGAAEILGFRLTENFAQPYLAESVAEFWRRWHISLTSWFRDYLYIPLGGNRKGKLRKYCNIMIVFLVSGLWHGAEWSFVVWGGLNGIYQVLSECFKPVREKIIKLLKLTPDLQGNRLAKVIGTFVLVDFTWIFFRADTIQDALQIIKSIFTVHNPWILFDFSLYELGLDRANFCLMLLAIAILFAVDILKKKGYSICRIVLEQDWWFRWTFYLAAFFFVVIFGLYGTNYGSSFIYFQF